MHVLELFHYDHYSTDLAVAFVIRCGLPFIMFWIVSFGQLSTLSYSYCIANIFCYYISVTSHYSSCVELLGVANITLGSYLLIVLVK